MKRYFEDIVNSESDDVAYYGSRVDIGNKWYGSRCIGPLRFRSHRHIFRKGVDRRYVPSPTFYLPGQAYVTYLEWADMTVIAWIDFSRDKRSKAFSSFVGHGNFSAEYILERAQELFPDVMERQSNTITVLTTRVEKERP